MSFDILHRWTGAILYHAETADTLAKAVIEARQVRANLSGANLSRANLSGANLSGANLSGANLSGANLSRANLSRANLSRADLSRANLSGANLSGANLSRANLSRANLSRADLSRANLSGANLSGAKNYHPHFICDLLILRDQPGNIIAYKMVTAEGDSPIQMTEKIRYKIGKSYEIAKANTDENELCAAGINVATSPWICREWKTGNRILKVQFRAEDIAAIPTATDGKFRLHRCRVVGEIDPKDWGLPVPEEVKS